VDVVVETDRAARARFAIGMSVVSLAVLLGAGWVISEVGGFPGFLASLVGAVAGLGALIGLSGLSRRGTAPAP
jgi:hypothetical protein